MRINIVIAGRNYPLNVPEEREEILRKVGKQIEMMIRDFEAKFNVKDKQDALAMCALELGTKAETSARESEENVKDMMGRLQQISNAFED